MRIETSCTLIFTTVVDEMSRGLEEEEAEPPADRAYWEQKATRNTVGLIDQLAHMLKQLDPALLLKYNKFYIGLSRDGQPYNVVRFCPTKNHVNMMLSVPQNEDMSQKLEMSGLENVEYNKRWRSYKVPLTTDEVASKADVLRELMKLAYDQRAA
jgi:predicted transport protein